MGTIKSVASQWFLPSKVKLRFVMGLLALLSIPLAWKSNRIRAQHEAVQAVRRNGGQVYFDYQWVNGQLSSNPKSMVPGWIRALIGDEAFHDVVWVRIGSILQDRSVLKRLKCFHKLQILSLNTRRIEDADLANIEGLSRLKSLDLAGTVVTDAGLKHLRKLDDLVYLFLNDTAVGDIGMEELGQHRLLQHLDLSRTRVTDRGLHSLGRLDGLRMLVLNETAVTGVGLKDLLSLGQLVSLSLDETNVSAEEVIEFRQNASASTSVFKGP